MAGTVYQEVQLGAVRSLSLSFRDRSQPCRMVHPFLLQHLWRHVGQSQEPGAAYQSLSVAKSAKLLMARQLDSQELWRSTAALTAR